MANRGNTGKTRQHLLIVNAHIPEDKNKCWDWLNCLNADGYPILGRSVADKTALAHRQAYEFFVGPIAPGMNVCHSCDNRKCINPSHLWLGSHTENYNDMVQKGRRNFGRGNRKSSLSIHDAEELWREMKAGLTIVEAAKKHSISPATAQKIRNRKTWQFR